jgi:fumarate reductase flavoprotein subunit
VLVIGGGAAGFSAAVEAKAADPAATVVLIEKQDFAGGSSILSAGIIYAAIDQQDKAVMKQYYMDRAQDYADEALLQYFADHSGETVPWLGESHFIPFPPDGSAGTALEPRAKEEVPSIPFRIPGSF